MPEPHKRANRHPKYTTAYRVNNWPEYDKSLRNRGDITLWISQDAIDAWIAPKTGKRGPQLVYADLDIETALTFKLLFRLPLRQTEGFLHSIISWNHRVARTLLSAGPLSVGGPHAWSGHVARGD